MHNISFFTLKSRFANVSERLTLRFQRWLAASSNQIEKQLVNQNLISSLLDLLKLQFMQFKWWGRGNASSLHASHCCVLGEQGRRIFACGAQLSVPQHQCLSESNAGEAKDFIPFHLGNKCVVSSCGELLGVQVTQVTWIFIASALLPSWSASVLSYSY